MASDASLRAVRAAIDRECLDLAATEIDDIPPRLHRFVTTRLALMTGGRAETALALLTLGRAVVETLHERVGPAPGDRECGCRGASWSRLDHLIDVTDTDPPTAFAQWLRECLRVFAAEHPRSPQTRAAELLRHHSSKGWVLGELAGSVGVSPARLRQDFRDRFGTTPSGYVQLVRVTRAVILLESTAKVESVALDIGYRSKKDLYAALARWVNATPGELRGLPPEERAWLVRQLRVRALRGLRREEPRSISGAIVARATPARRASRR